MARKPAARKPAGRKPAGRKPALTLSSICDEALDWLTEKSTRDPKNLRPALTKNVIVERLILDAMERDENGEDVLWGAKKPAISRQLGDLMHDLEFASHKYSQANRSGAVWASTVEAYRRLEKRAEQLEVPGVAQFCRYRQGPAWLSLAEEFRLQVLKSGTLPEGMSFNNALNAVRHSVSANYRYIRRGIKPSVLFNLACSLSAYCRISVEQQLLRSDRHQGLRDSLLANPEYSFEKVWCDNPLGESESVGRIWKELFGKPGVSKAADAALDWLDIMVADAAHSAPAIKALAKSLGSQKAIQKWEPEHSRLDIQNLVSKSRVDPDLLFIRTALGFDDRFSEWLTKNRAIETYECNLTYEYLAAGRDSEEEEMDGYFRSVYEEDIDEGSP